MTTEDLTALRGFLEQARWFGDKGRSFEITGVETLPLEEGVRILLVEIGFTGGERTRYQVPLSSYAQPQERIEHALVGTWDGRFHYDAVHDREAMGAWQRGFGGRPGDDPRLRFVTIGEHALDPEAHSTLFSGEQSNSSVAFGEDALLKVFRKVTAGTNPDIELHEQLTLRGSTHIAALYGYLAAGSGSEELQLGMLQQFLRTASDGWELALASVRNLFGEADLHADEVGGDFAGESFRLGATLAEVHGDLAEAFGTSRIDAGATAAAMTLRLRSAAAEVAELAPYVADLTDLFASVADLGEHPAHRIHGDLHLGQTLRTSLGWKLVDFEGEPAKPLAERRLPDSPWRDLAGMTRSFDYAAAIVLGDLAAATDEAAQMEYRAREWATRNSEAFLAGYTEQRGRPGSEADRLLLDAYIADKAVYEVGYEAHHRPDWIGIPLRALASITGGPGA